MPRHPVRNMWKLAAALAGAVSGVPRTEAAWLHISAPVQVAAGWTRIAGRYGSTNTRPTFQTLARCGGVDAPVHVLDQLTHLAPEVGAFWIDLPSSPDRLAPDESGCETPAVSVEMVEDATVVAAAPVQSRAGVAKRLRAAALAPPPAAPPRIARRFRLSGQKHGAPTGKRTEAGLGVALDKHVTVQLHYERTSPGPMMSYEHDDGILARLRVGF